MYRYRLCLSVADNTAVTNITAFGGMLNAVFGTPASQLFKKYVSVRWYCVFQSQLTMSIIKQTQCWAGLLCFDCLFEWIFLCISSILRGFSVSTCDPKGELTIISTPVYLSIIALPVYCAVSSASYFWITVYRRVGRWFEPSRLIVPTWVYCYSSR